MGRDETPRRSGARDLERYAGLFAQRTQAMKSSAMRDLMAVTAQPEIISLTAERVRSAMTAGVRLAMNGLAGNPPITARPVRRRAPFALMTAAAPRSELRHHRRSDRRLGVVSRSGAAPFKGAAPNAAVAYVAEVDVTDFQFVEKDGISSEA